MKKYLLAFLLLLNVAVFAQNLTHSVSQEITSGSVRCTNEFGGGNNTYLRFFKLEDLILLRIIVLVMWNLGYGQ